MSQNKNNKQGESLSIILIILFGWTCFACADATSKHLTQSYNPSFIITVGALWNSALTIGWILYRRGIAGFKSKNYKLLAARALSIGLVSFTIVNAFALIPIADVYGVTFASPFVTVALAAYLLKEDVGLHRWLAISIGFIGVIILVGPQFQTINIGLVYAIAACFALGISTIFLRIIGKSEYMPLLFLCSFVGMIVVNFPLSLPHFVMPPFKDAAIIFANAAFVYGGVLGTAWGYAHAKNTAAVAPFIYTQVIWGVLFGYMFFDNIPTLTTFIGLFIVVSAGMYMIWRERQLRKVSRT